MEMFPFNNLPNLASFRHQAMDLHKQIPLCVLWRSETKGTAMRHLQESTMVALSWTTCRCRQSKKVTSCSYACITDRTGL